MCDPCSDIPAGDGLLLEKTKLTTTDTCSIDEGFGKWKNGGGEGSFLSIINDTSETDISKLIKDAVESDETKVEWKLDTFLPEVREQIWKRLPCSDLKNVRGTCRKFHSEIDNEIGIQLYLCDNNDESLRLALTTTVQRLIILHLEMSMLGNLIPYKPTRLKELKIQGCVNTDALHEILLRCPNIRKLEIDHCYNEEKIDPNSSVREKFQNWLNGNLFKPLDEIRYAYAFFSKLQEINFQSSETAYQHTNSLICCGLLPILKCVNSSLLSKIDINIHVTPEESKALNETIFQLFLRSPALNFLNLSHFHPDYEPSQDPDPNHVDKPNIKTGFYAMKFSVARPVPQFLMLKLETPEHPSGYFDWLFLLQKQRRLKKLVWDVGCNYYTHPIDAVKKSAKTLESLTLRMIRCYQINSDSVSPPSPLSLANFREFIKLKHLHLTGVEMTFESSQFSCVDGLPNTLQNIQIECFKLSTEQLFQIHRTLPALKFLSVNHWNMRTNRANFIGSLKVITEIVSTPGKYKALTFLEKTMYNNAEELAEINELLNEIKQSCKGSGLQVDDVSCDNGIGFILVIGIQNQSTGN